MLNSIFSLALNATTSAVGRTPKIEFTPSGFIEQLPTMGFGMLGIFIVIGIIVGIT